VAASFVVLSLVIESLAVMVLATWTLLASAPPTVSPSVRSAATAGQIITTVETGSMRRR
jgi:hypothetical protein